MIFRLLAMLLISLGFSNKTPAPKYDLRKHEEKSPMKVFVTRYFDIILIITIIIALIVFVWVCFTFVGVSVESGNMYNHLMDVI